MKVFRVVAIMMILIVLSFVQPLAFNGTEVSAADSQVNGESIITQTIIDDFMTEINAFRAEEGLQPVVYNYSLQAGADIRAGETIESFAHTRPNGQNFGSAFVNPNELIRMENIAAGFSTTGQVMEVWKNSSGHRANMLIADLKSIVLGVNNPPMGSTFSRYWVLVGSGTASLTGEENNDKVESDDDTKDKAEADKVKADKAEADKAKAAKDKAKADADKAAAKSQTNKSDAKTETNKSDAKSETNSNAKSETNKANKEAEQSAGTGKSNNNQDTPGDNGGKTDSAANVAEGEKEVGQRLPDTATPTWTIILAGSLLVLMAPFLIMMNRQTRNGR